MSVNPVHSNQQVTLQATQNIAKQHAKAVNKDGNVQARSNEEIKKKVEKDSTRVRTVKKAYKSKVVKKKEDNKKDSNDKKNNEENEGTIDIRI